MGKSGVGIAFAAAIAVTVIAVDLAFFRDQPIRRLIANVSIVIIYAGIYIAFFKKN
jgi:hypothetical protein